MSTTVKELATALDAQVIYGGTATAKITSSTQKVLTVYFDAKDGYTTIPFGAATNGWTGSPYITSFSDTQAEIWWSNTEGQSTSDGNITVFLLYIKK